MTTANYRTERLLPSLGVLAFAVLITMSLGIAFARFYGYTFGMTVGLWLTLATLVAMVVTSPVVSTSPAGFRAGPALLPWTVVGAVEVCDAQRTRSEVGRGANVRNYFLIRGWIAQAIVVQVQDATDPHPAWVVSTRSPQELAESVRWAVHESGATHDQ